MSSSHRQSGPTPGQRGQRGQRRIRFAGDSSLTFINYEPESDERFAYRREARLHNARRRVSRNANVTSGDQAQIQGLLGPAQPTSLIDALSTYVRDPFHHSATQSARSIEQTWHAAFPEYFGLPDTLPPSSGLPNPSTIFLTTAKESQDLYRSIVLQVVASANAEKGVNDGDTLFQNQALILRDFRELAEKYGVPAKRLTSVQFQHVFASAFSFSGKGFDKEAGYNAIVLMNSMFMSGKQHVAVIQTPISEWFRMLMPRPGPSFNRSQEFQTEMLWKVDLTLEFLERTQNSLREPYPAHVSRFLGANNPLYKIVTMKIPDQIATEPYPGFYSICRHRVLSMLLRHLGHVAQSDTPENNVILQTLENQASMCLQYRSPQSISLFLWCQLLTAQATGLNRDQDEPLFSWAMKDLLFVHGLVFVDEMVAWITLKSQSAGIVEPPMLDIAELRRKMQAHYQPEVTA